MKTKLLSLVAIFMIAVFSNNLNAQTTANVDNNATAEIIQIIGITAGADLAFGEIIVGAGDVIISTAGARTINAAMDPGTQSTYTAGVFNVTGQPLYTYAITLPDDVTVTITEGTDPMAVTAFNCFTADDADAGLDGTLDALGDDVITVGATLTVAVDQVVGSYTGLFNVVVAYN